ncbi:MAG TPA: flagellar export protein FliJ [Polyangiaceae bacterium]|jgi:flagellar FliJ protein|nr:flagellar export protein FliJ [Polyangiaceae bacterium]
MKRSERLELVKKVVDDFERRKAEALAMCERRVLESEKKLTDLENYRTGYVHDFAVRAKAGIGGAAARDYQVFLGRLDEAVHQQSQAVIGTRAQRDAERQNWQDAVQRAEAIGQTVQRWQGEERHALDRREQHESDERSQRIWAQGMTTRGA